MSRKNRDEQNVLSARDSEIVASKEYAEGRQAFLDGFTEGRCPYPIGSGDKRIFWCCGHQRERIGTELADVFRRNRIEWP